MIDSIRKRCEAATDVRNRTGRLPDTVAVDDSLTDIPWLIAEVEKPCPLCARLRDREGLAKAICEKDRWPISSKEYRMNCFEIADAIIKYVEER